LKTVQGTNEEFYVLQVTGISDGQQYFLRPSVFVPDITWDKIRPKGGEPNTGELAYNVFAVKLSDPAQLKEMQQIISQRVERVETADIITAYKKTPGYAEQQATLDTQRIFTLIIGVLVLAVLPDSDAAESAADRHVESDRRAQSHRGCGVHLPGDGGDHHRRGDWRRVHTAAGGELSSDRADCV
jgi:hypothetical protein